LQSTPTTPCSRPTSRRARALATIAYFTFNLPLIKCGINSVIWLCLTLNFNFELEAFGDLLVNVKFRV
jgi:hypothetical protein